MTYDEIEERDVVYVCGGNTFFLLDRMRQYGFESVLRKFMQEDKAYVGVSAGSIVVAPTIAIAAVEPGDPNDVGLSDLTGLNIIDFEVSPHVPEVVAYESIEEYAKHTQNTVYAFDYKTALCVEDTGRQFVGDGRSKIYN